MTFDTDSSLEAIREFVARFEGVRDVQFDRVPYPMASHEGITYLLLVASINQGAPAEHIRHLMGTLYEELGEDLLHIHKLSPSRYDVILDRFQLPGWKIWKELPRILASASGFAAKVKLVGGFVERGRRQKSTLDAADRIATSVYFMGRNPEGARKKVWMFMRWMVRPAPDIGAWNPPLAPADLRVPLDSNTGRAFLDLQNRSPIGARIVQEGLQLEIRSGAVASTASNVERVTQIARWIFPEDPARVDYAFFCYGRRFSPGDDTHRCWRIVGCDRCPIRIPIQCRGRLP